MPWESLRLLASMFFVFLINFFPLCINSSNPDVFMFWCLWHLCTTCDKRDLHTQLMQEHVHNQYNWNFCIKIRQVLKSHTHKKKKIKREFLCRWDLRHSCIILARTSHIADMCGKLEIDGRRYVFARTFQTVCVGVLDYS